MWNSVAKSGRVERRVTGSLSSLVRFCTSPAFGTLTRGDLSWITWQHPAWVQALTRPPTPTPHWHWRLKPVTNLILKSDQITMKIWFVLLLQLISWRIFNWTKLDKICSLVLPVFKRYCSPQVATTSSSANLLVLVSRSLGLIMASCQITRLPKCQKRWMSDRLVFNSNWSEEHCWGAKRKHPLVWMRGSSTSAWHNAQFVAEPWGRASLMRRSRKTGGWAAADPKWVPLKIRRHRANINRISTRSSV